MNTLCAQNRKQLDICLRLLYAEKVKWVVNVYEDNKNRIRYTIDVYADGEVFDGIREKYRILIS